MKSTGSCIKCSASQHWDGFSCRCNLTQSWNGTECINVCSEGSYFDGSSCVTCASYQMYDVNSRSCINQCSPSSGYFYHSPWGCQSCTPNQFYDGTSCICKFNELWNGSQCYEQCPPGQFYNNNSGGCVSCAPHQIWYPQG